MSKLKTYDVIMTPSEDGAWILKSEVDAYIRKMKYKRCLAMARWCDEVMLSCELRGYTVHRIWANKHKWAMRWKYRWLKIAEKFKHNSTAQQGKG